MSCRDAGNILIEMLHVLVCFQFCLLRERPVLIAEHAPILALQPARVLAEVRMPPHVVQRGRHRVEPRRHRGEVSRVARQVAHPLQPKWL